MLGLLLVIVVDGWVATFVMSRIVRAMCRLGLMQIKPGPTPVDSPCAGRPPRPASRNGNRNRNAELLVLETQPCANSSLLTVSLSIGSSNKVRASRSLPRT